MGFHKEINQTETLIGSADKHDVKISLMTHVQMWQNCDYQLLTKINFGKQTLLIIHNFFLITMVTEYMNRLAAHVTPLKIECQKQDLTNDRFVGNACQQLCQIFILPRKIKGWYVRNRGACWIQLSCFCLLVCQKVGLSFINS